MHRPLLAAGLAVVGCAAFGCILVTGSTNGYGPEDAGSGKTVLDAGTCIAESGVCFFTQCLSNAECDAGQVCCLGATAPAGLTCRSSCGFGAVQVCAGNTECGDAGACVEQQCLLTPTTYDLKLCGLAPGCTEVGPASTAGGSDASGD